MPTQPNIIHFRCNFFFFDSVAFCLFNKTIIKKWKILFLFKFEKPNQRYVKIVKIHICMYSYVVLEKKTEKNRKKAFNIHIKKVMYVYLSGEAKDDIKKIIGGGEQRGEWCAEA